MLKSGELIFLRRPVTITFSCNFRNFAFSTKSQKRLDNFFCHFHLTNLMLQTIFPEIFIKIDYLEQFENQR